MTLMFLVKDPTKSTSLDAGLGVVAGGGVNTGHYGLWRSRQRQCSEQWSALPHPLEDFREDFKEKSRVLGFSISHLVPVASVQSWSYPSSGNPALSTPLEFCSLSPHCLSKILGSWFPFTSRTGIEHSSKNQSHGNQK